MLFDLLLVYFETSEPTEKAKFRPWTKLLVLSLFTSNFGNPFYSSYVIGHEMSSLKLSKENDFFAAFFC